MQRDAVNLYKQIYSALKIAALAALLVWLAVPAAFAQDYGRISQNELEAMMQRPGALKIVDVREPELFDKGHIPGAINIPYETAHKRVLKELDPSDRIVFVCHGGPMGDELAEILVTNGFKKVYNLIGGMRWWNGPLEK